MQKKDGLANKHSLHHSISSLKSLTTLGLQSLSLMDQFNSPPTGTSGTTGGTTQQEPEGLTVGQGSVILHGIIYFIGNSKWLPSFEDFLEP
jgi:hypothetical protein